jgi:hypothetical protein
VPYSYHLLSRKEIILSHCDFDFLAPMGAGHFIVNDAGVMRQWRAGQEVEAGIRSSAENTFNSGKMNDVSWAISSCTEDGVHYAVVKVWEGDKPHNPLCLPAQHPKLPYVEWSVPLCGNPQENQRAAAHLSDVHKALIENRVPSRIHVAIRGLARGVAVPEWWNYALRPINPQHANDAKRQYWQSLGDAVRTTHVPAPPVVKALLSLRLPKLFG